MTKKENRLTPEMAICVEKALGCSADHLLRMQLAHDLAQARSGAIKVTRLVAKAA